MCPKKQRISYARCSSRIFRKSIPHRITVRHDAESNIIDTIDYSSKDVMKYVAPDGKVPLHVVGTDVDGNEYTSDVEATLYDSDGQQYWIWRVDYIGEAASTPLV